MALLDLQRKATQLGRIRIGCQVPTKGGKTRPAKLETFRLTTPSRSTADAVAALLGGKVLEFTTARTAGQWEVTTQLAELPVMIPPTGALTQHYELWSGGGCVRRCDSQREQISGGACLCPADGVARQAAAQSGHACKAMTRLNVVLPDLPGVGLWRLDTGGYYAAVELAGVAEMLEQAALRGISVPASLAIEQREVRRPDQQVKRFPVPVLRVAATLRELAAVQSTGGGVPLVAQLPPPPALLALSAGQERAQAVEAGPSAQRLADRAAHAGSPDDMRGLWREAERFGWLDEFVQGPGQDVMDALRHVLEDRAKALTVVSEGGR